MGEVMRFIFTLLIVGAIVFAVLYFSGFDVMGHLGQRAVRTASRTVNNEFFTTNVIAGIVSGLIVAVIQGMFSRR